MPARPEEDPFEASSGGELQRVKRVWILGSGFSKPLGGPLLVDLLSPGFQARVQARYHKHKLWPVFERLYPFFWHGKEAGHFKHAEDFLVQLDDESDVNVRRLNAIYLGALTRDWSYSSVKVALEDIRDAATLLVAAECSMHVPDSDSGQESLIPYRAWAQSLCDQDAIISFNYDPLIERLRPDRRLKVVGPDDPRYHSIETMNEQTWLFKMHGSLDWSSEDALHETKCVKRGDGGYGHPVIGIPGSSKYGLSQSPLFTDIWGFASVALRHTEEVHIIGYSMPESDSYAISYLLRNLQKNRSDHLDVNIVLGQPGFATERLSQMLTLALSERSVIPRPRPRYVSETMHETDQLLRGMGVSSASLSVRVWAAYTQDYLVARSRDPDGEAVP